MLKTIISIIPELLGVVFGDPARISHRWIEFKEDMAEHRKQEAQREARRKAREPKRPLTHGCPDENSAWGLHKWEHKYDGWNSGIYDSGAVGRGGWRCYHCNEVSWDKTDEEFIKEQPEWLLIQATGMPKKFLEHFTNEQLQKRLDFHHDKKVRGMQHEQEGLRVRLAELDEVEQNGGMLLTGNT